MTDWWMFWATVAGAVANAFVGLVAVCIVLYQRRAQLADKAAADKERLAAHEERVKMALIAAEEAAYEVQTTWWQIEENMRSRELMKHSGPCDFHLWSRNLERKANRLSLMIDSNLPLPVLNHLFGVQRLIREAIDVLHLGNDTDGKKTLFDLLGIRHSADAEQDANKHLTRQFTAENLSVGANV